MTTAQSDGLAPTANAPDTSGAGIRSMTGQGRAQCSADCGTVTVEIRSVNNRGIKVSVRTPDSLADLAATVETTVRKWVHRGSFTVNLTWRPKETSTAVKVNTDVVSSYFRQIKDAQTHCGVDQDIDWVGLMQLPGVLVSDGATDRVDQTLRDLVNTTLRHAVDALDQMRQREGAEMAASLTSDLGRIAGHVETIKGFVPDTVQRYRDRLESKVRSAIDAYDLKIDSIDLLREIQIYADRVDISEEITRLESHLKLFGQVLGGDSLGQNGPSTSSSTAGPDSPNHSPAGRRLDFVIQEMVRETNTIGSKASNADVSAQVVEVKCALERMREMVQNLE
ncbi:YicC family protein [Crateriforma conspicua]|uniref:YicC family protein n=2 Tax=Crateriforma conspicua TaxID=2527996 RepID=A0A5C5Y877_9PLAN|nr:DUF1732 domain-containing protein [Crateriforma conspicua]TWT71158.1 Conserved hypothetical protein CHP00255 [Crateriforma conspicua]